MAHEYRSLAARSFGNGDGNPGGISESEQCRKCGLYRYTTKVYGERAQHDYDTIGVYDRLGVPRTHLKSEIVEATILACAA